MSTESVTLRRSRTADEGALATLAELDSAGMPAGPMLVAESGGALRAALSLPDGRVIADPFHPTAGLVELLRARARQLEGTGPAGRRRVPWRRRVHAWG